jgi:hypothetical protein
LAPGFIDSGFVFLYRKKMNAKNALASGQAGALSAFN